jgi:hypothetical protein
MTADRWVETTPEDRAFIRTIVEALDDLAELHLMPTEDIRAYGAARTRYLRGEPIDQEADKLRRVEETLDAHAIEQTRGRR